MINISGNGMIQNGRFSIKLLTGLSLLFFIFSTVYNLPGDTLPEQKNWYESSFLGLIYVIQAGGTDTELGAGLSKEHIRQELEKVNPDFVMYDSKGHPGYSIYPTKIGYPSPGIVKDGLKLWREVTRELGIRLIVQYSGIWDNAALLHHPDWAALTPEGKPFGNYVCLNSGYVEKILIPQMIEIIDMYDVDGIWIDGDCWAAMPCWCERCRDLFTAKTGIEDAPMSGENARWNDWLAFHRQNFFAYVTSYCDAVHARKPGCLVCSNWLYSIRTPEGLTVPVDYTGGDVPAWDSIERIDLEGRFFDGRRMPWDIIAWTFCSSDREAWTMKPMDHLMLETSLILTAGGKVSLFNLPERSGHLNGWQQDILAETARFVRARQSVAQGSESAPQVALLHSTSHYYSQNAPLFNPGAATLPLEGALRALLENHYHVDVLNEETLSAKIAGYNCVVIPEQTLLPKPLVEKIKQYVRDGGHLLVTGISAADDFGDILGVEKIEDPKNGIFYFPVDDGLATYKGPVQLVHPAKAETLKELFIRQEIETGGIDVPIATAAACGKGIAGAVHASIFEYFAAHRYPAVRSFLGAVFSRVAPEQMVEIEAPPSVTLAVRKQDKAVIIHLINRSSAYPMSAENGNTVEKIMPAGPLYLKIRYPDKPESVRMAPEDTGLSWKWEQGMIKAEINRLEIHSAIVIE